MPVPKHSDLKTVSVVLTKDQVERLQERRQAQSSHLRRVSFADVCREVVEAGLDSFSHASIIPNVTSTDNPTASAA